jgi:NAD/NADP transhydrogenase alpha subunit
MRIGIPKEIHPGERRVAATPMTVARMRKLGLDIVVQAGAGEASDYGDGAYLETGATIAPDAASLWSQADLVLKVRPPEAVPESDLHEADLLEEGAALMARQSSDLYATTVCNLLADVLPLGGAALALDLEDEIHRGVVVLQDGKLLWPPPTRPRPRSVAPLTTTTGPSIPAPAKPPSRIGPLLGGLVAMALLAAGVVAGGEFVEHLTVFLLACVVGWHVIWNVNPALHTPLMSVTNAISGIILVGGILLMRTGSIGAATLLAAVAILIATINVSGGFLVTARMLRMFRR